MDIKSVLFYDFYFDGIPTPITIEALSKDEAVGFLQRHPEYVPAPVVNLKVYKPLFGVTQKEEHGITFIWCGFENSHSGWMEVNKFNALSRNILK